MSVEARSERQRRNPRHNYNTGAKPNNAQNTDAETDIYDDVSGFFFRCRR
jgi:hypothetical protein